MFTLCRVLINSRTILTDIFRNKNLPKAWKICLNEVLEKLWKTKPSVLLWEITSSLGNRLKSQQNNQCYSSGETIPLPAMGYTCTQNRRLPCTHEQGLMQAVSFSQATINRRSRDVCIRQMLVSEVTVTHGRAADAGDTRTWPTAFITMTLIFQASSMRPGRSSYVTKVPALPHRRHPAPRAVRPDTTRRLNS